MTLKPGDINLASHADMSRHGSPVYQYFEMLRREAPVWWNPPPSPQNPRYRCPGFWVLSKYDDVAMASKDPVRFSAWENSVLWTNPKDNPDALNAQRAGLMGMDPPQHTQYRRLVQPGLTPRKIASLEPFIREQAQDVVAEMAARDEVEFVFEVAAELPMILLCQLMGVPQEKREAYLRLGNDVANFEFNEQFEQTMIDLYLFLDEVVQSRGGLQDDTMLSKYLHGEVDGRQLTRDEITQFFLTLSIAGHETTRNTTAHFVRLMDEHPDQRELLLEDLDGRLPNAIEEVLRYSPPVMQFCRTATCDIELRGATIAKDDKVYLSYISANRDEEVFEDPNRFDILRPNADAHLAFGTGPHFCLGASLARTQLRCVIGELYRQLPDIELAGPPTPLNSVWFNGITAMPARPGRAAVTRTRGC
ncbi:MAG: cytochrome P450 [bacterium]|nr:cytochrome P450 [bacterium]